MRNKILLSFLSVLVIALIVILGRGVGAIKQPDNGLPLIFRASSEKQTYILGEAVELNFDLTNKGDKAIRIPLSPDVYTGYLSIWIASDGQQFNQYRNTSWGLRETGGPTLQPEQSFVSTATILWNSKPETLNLNPDVIKGRIVSDYAFPRAGIYSIKAVATITGSTPMKIESEPIQIVINEPVGDDLKVWNQIKNNGNIAYFIQQGGTPTYQDEKSEKLLKEMEQITEQYPNSFLAGEMKQKLEKFRVDEERRKEMLEKARVKRKQP